MSKHPSGNRPSREAALPIVASSAHALHRKNGVVDSVACEVDNTVRLLRSFRDTAGSDREARLERLDSQLAKLNAACSPGPGQPTSRIAQQDDEGFAAPP